MHLLGQSWGGILAYEWLRRAHGTPLSLTLSNSPADVNLVEAEAEAMVAEIGALGRSGALAVLPVEGRARQLDKGVSWNNPG